MEKLLIISQKYPEADLSYRQDKSLIETIDKLKANFDVEYLYIHKSFDDGKKAPYKFNVKTRDFFSLTENEFATKALAVLIKGNGFKNVFFTSIFVARAIIPLIDDVLSEVNIIVDSRLATSFDVLKTRANADEQERDGVNKEVLSFAIKEMAVLRCADSIVTENFEQTEFMQKYISSRKFVLYENLQAEKSFTSKQKKEKTITLGKVVIDTSNSADILSENLHLEKSESLGENISFNTVKIPNTNTIRNINEVIKKSKEDFIIFCYDKIVMHQRACETMLEALHLNSKMAAVIPVITDLNFNLSSHEASAKRHSLGAFGNWHEPNFSKASCVAINRNIMLKIGIFDEKFKTLDYAFFDFAMRAYQAGYLVLHLPDALVYKTSLIAPNLPKEKQDKAATTVKWNDYNFYHAPA